MKYGISLCLLILLGACNQNDKNTNHTHPENEHDEAPAQGTGEILEKTIVPATPYAPEYLQLARNVEVIPNILDTTKLAGVLTHEGVFGPYLFAENIRAFYIQLKPGMFLTEHPHPTESIVYTVSGKWVLCSEGKRQVMETGSLFHFGSNMPTGWEAPFAEGAFLLVLKAKEKGEAFEPYIKGLIEMKGTLDEERKNGTAFYFNELKPDHPAILFARLVNPNFDEVLKSIPY